MAARAGRVSDPRPAAVIVITSWTDGELTSLENDLGCALMYDPAVAHDGEIGGIVAATRDGMWRAPALPLNHRQ